MDRVGQLLASRRRGIMGQAPQVHTAVLVPLCGDADQLSVIFTKRAATLRRQPGEISFPGGHMDERDSDERATAIRETAEELGIRPGDIEYLGALDVLVAWSGLIVHPFVGRVPDVTRLQLNPAEVDEAFALSLDRLLACQPRTYDVPLRPLPPEDFPFDLIPGGRDYAWRSGAVRQWFYEIDGRVIWGLTARILTHFLDVVRAGMPQSPSDQRR